jgi:hypothetical protein
MFPSTDAFSRVTSLYDVTLSTELYLIANTTRRFLSSLELLSSLSVNLNTPLPVAPISEVLFTPDSTLREFTSFIKISTGLRTNASENSDF